MTKFGFVWCRSLFLQLVIFGSFIANCSKVMATESVTPQQAHWSVISNQVRGSECCGAGGLNELQQEVKITKQLNLPATFSIRYDALTDPRYVRLLQTFPDAEIAGLLEITPELAEAAGVTYNGTPERWYEAQTVFLIGQNQDDRKKIIDTYMSTFKKVFGYFPKSTVAWMIDAYSLRYLKQNYGVLVHQITREQWGVDSYTLYGGPVHMPYWPTENWSMIPASQPSAVMPLVVRQTIIDPVWVYGDGSSSYTSQPNDYALRGESIEYFKHLFLQAHAQNETQHTFSVIGLENSMAAKDYHEYEQQLQFVREWQKNTQNATVTTLAGYATWRQTQPNSWPQLHSAVSFGDSQSERAWWITTPAYRVRLRLSNGELFISDIRVYDLRMQDPYLESTAKSQGWFVVPFVLDGSRYFAAGDSRNFASLYFDTLSTARPVEPPSRLLLEKGISPKADLLVTNNNIDVSVSLNGTKLALFEKNKFALKEPFVDSSTSPVLHAVVEELQWIDETGKPLWGLTQSKSDGMRVFSPFYLTDLDQVSSAALLNRERTVRYPFLFPELLDHPVSAKDSDVVVSNRYAIAARNPSRLVVYPRGEKGYPVQTPSSLPVRTIPEVTVTSQQQSASKGYTFVDIMSNEPRSVQVALSLGGEERFETVFFAPNCKVTPKDCLRNPRYLLWYVKLKWQDWKKSQELQQNFAP